MISYQIVRAKCGDVVALLKVNGSQTGICLS